MAGIMVFVRRADGDTHALELDADATVGDLKREAARAFPEVAHNGLRFAGSVLTDDSKTLADAEFSNQVTVDVDVSPLRWCVEGSSERSIITDEGKVAGWKRKDDRGDYCAEVIVGTQGWTSGRHYWEVKLEVWDGSGSGRDVIGVCSDRLFHDEGGVMLKEKLTMKDVICGMGSSAHCWGVGMWQSPWRKEHDSEEGNFNGAPSPKEGDRVGILLDLDRAFIRFYLNGYFMGSDEADSTFSEIPRGDTFRPALSVGRLADKHKYRLITDPEKPEDGPRPRR